MKRILITGAGSYIGTNVSEYLLKQPDKYSVTTIDMKDSSWKSFSFKDFDAVYHVAGIAHADVENVSEETKALYYRVNCDLAFECAKKTKEEGVKQFIFMSSMIVYPGATRYGVVSVINKNTEPNPDNFYGDSKLQAEIKINTLADDSFKVVILRPPMIYGKGSKGNYRTIAKMAEKLPVFPKVNNQRSMLYVENLCEFVRLMIDNEESGTFFPQNAEYTNTSEMVKEISIAKGKHIALLGVFTPFIKLISCMNNKYGKLVNKAFGSLVYDMGISEYKENYRLYDLKESIKRSEGGEK
ncbi:MAG: NAD-dependent epimerase/dehydratase family protein [Lachnospiraceae bacterium]|nr:NAD-dependent epimerase/dehydratase family protein [Lachnospiraceae bacterium]